MPLISVSRAHTLGKILWLIGDLDPEHLETVERVAVLSYADQYGQIDWDRVAVTPEIRELAAVVRALSFFPDDEVVAGPVEAAAAAARAS